MDEKQEPCVVCIREDRWSPCKRCGKCICPRCEREHETWEEAKQKIASFQTDLEAATYCMIPTFGCFHQNSCYYPGVVGYSKSLWNSFGFKLKPGQSPADTLTQEIGDIERHFSIYKPEQVERKKVRTRR